MATKVNTPLNYVSLFSCAGVGCYGFKQEGFACIASVGLEERRLQIQKYNNKCKYESGYISGDIKLDSTKQAVFRSEFVDRFSVGALATHMHHIFPKSSFPTIADYVENLIALTSAQHMQEAHPNGNTQLIDKDFRYMCLICKTESIRRNLQDGFGTPMFYSFENYMTVIDTGFGSTFFMGLE